MIDIYKTVEDIKSSFLLPSPPLLLKKAHEICRSDDPDLIALGDLISSDIGLSLAIIKAVNSPIYGLNRKISDVKQAVFLLGLQSSEVLISSVLIQQSFIGESAINLESLWEHSNRVASASMFIGKNIKDIISSEKLFTLGLFHDCGVAAMSIKFKETYKDCFKTAYENTNLKLTDIEDRNYKTTHAIVGHIIASIWKLPKDICKVILCHHDLRFFDFNKSHSENLLMSVLKIAENISSCEFKGYEIHEWRKHKELYFYQLGITEYEYLDIKDELVDLWNSEI